MSTWEEKKPHDLFFFVFAIYCLFYLVLTLKSPCLAELMKP